MSVYSLAPGNRSIPMSNTTKSDMIMASCFNNFMVAACVRSSVLTFLAVITALLCIMKIVKLHSRQHPSWHQYMIFYTASLECTIGGVHWVIVAYAQMDFVLQYLKLIQFLVMCHYYWTLATRALRRERLTKWVLLPLLICVCIDFTVIVILGIVHTQPTFVTLFVIFQGIVTTVDMVLLPLLICVCIYFTVIAILGIVHTQPAFTECLQPYWLELSAAEFVTVQLFAIAGFYITKRLNEISTLDSVRWSQKRDLWCIVVVFEVSAFVGFLYDALLKILGDEDTGCSHIFRDQQELYSTVFVVFMVMKLLLPIWVMLFVFQPAPPITDSDDLIPALSDDGDNSPSPVTQDLTGSNGNLMKRSASSLDPISEETSNTSVSKSTRKSKDPPQTAALPQRISTERKILYMIL
ncbi:unnamed protein product [Mytilus coruscus]|uniref:Uncharacterized protein n=1 Tax=Mytilus coruscus TaxID=42192 RepID=A0A6J8CQV6_MYTCO|nr:unnamed protein product [Mytilus coruscus]